VVAVVPPKGGNDGRAEAVAHREPFCSLSPAAMAVRWRAAHVAHACGHLASCACSRFICLCCCVRSRVQKGKSIIIKLLSTAGTGYVAPSSSCALP
jgi:hypothetical protein